MSSGVSHLLPIHIQNEPIKHDPVGFGKHKSSLLRLCDLTLCAFVLAPLSICNWATTWDIAYYYMFNGSEADPATGVDANASAVASAATTATLNNGGETNSASSNGISDDLKFYYSILFTFIVSNVIIALTYVFQHDLQSYHDYLEHHRRRRSTKQHERAKGGDGYYGYDFLFRSLYTYVITTAYVLQWRTYWDLLEHWSTNISWKHSLPVSVFALLFHRYVLKTSLGSFSKTVPFYLVKDLQFEKFFLQSNDFKFRNKHVSCMVEFLYNEVIQVIITTYIWKGMWDMWAHVSSELAIALFGEATVNGQVLTTAVFGFASYYVLIGFQYGFLDAVSSSFHKLSRGLKILIMDMFYVLAFLSLSSIWYTVWNKFDTIVEATDGTGRACVVFFTHFLTVIILCCLKTSTALYGPAGSDTDLSNYEDTGSDGRADTHNVMPKNYSVFRISYLI